MGGERALRVAQFLPSVALLVGCISWGCITEGRGQLWGPHPHLGLWWGAVWEGVAGLR